MLVVFWGGQFQGSFKPLTDFLAEDTRVLRAYGDSYIEAQIEFTIAKVMYYFFKEERSAGYQEMNMKTPEACAAIFSKYWEEVVQSAKMEASNVHWISKLPTKKMITTYFPRYSLQWLPAVTWPWKQTQGTPHFALLSRVKNHSLAGPSSPQFTPPAMQLTN